MDRSIVDGSPKPLLQPFDVYVLGEGDYVKGFDISVHLGADVEFLRADRSQGALEEVVLGGDFVQVDVYVLRP